MLVKVSLSVPCSFDCSQVDSSRIPSLGMRMSLNRAQNICPQDTTIEVTKLQTCSSSLFLRPVLLFFSPCVAYSADYS